MKILHVGSPCTDFVGEFGLIFKVTKGLRDLNHEVDIMTTDADCFYYDKEKSLSYSPIRKKFLNIEKQPIIYKEIPTFVEHCSSHKLGLYCPNAKKNAREIVTNYDVIHVCTWYSHICMTYAQVAHEMNIPFIISSWGSLLPNARKLKKSRKWLIDKLYTNKIIKHADGYQSVGTSETEEYIKLGANPDSIFRLDNPVDLKKFELIHKTEILHKNDIKEKDFLLFLGRINEKKGIELLIESFVRISKEQQNLLLVIAGSGIQQYENQIKELVKEKNIQNKVKFTGLVSDDEKLELLHSATLFVLTSHSDVHPIAVQDALAMGLPVIITKACDYPEVKEYNAGIIVNEDTNEISNAVLEILDDKSKLRQMSKNAKRIILEKFQLEVQIKKYEQMYIDVIKNKN
tara:strand:- start:304 stop:1509 length:1206 start_codon:yes stop_codon:yes gene_type:complete